VRMSFLDRPLRRLSPPAARSTRYVQPGGRSALPPAPSPNQLRRTAQQPSPGRRVGIGPSRTSTPSPHSRGSQRAVPPMSSSEVFDSATARPTGRPTSPARPPPPKPPARGKNPSPLAPSAVGPCRTQSTVLLVLGPSSSRFKLKPLRLVLVGRRPRSPGELAPSVQQPAPGNIDGSLDAAPPVEKREDTGVSRRIVLRSSPLRADSRGA